MAKNDFEAVIGLEVHAQLSTKSKMFCGCSSDAFNAEPNVNCCPVCMGFPGQLPVINNEALNKGVKAALALHCKIPESSKFDRKNYFYPDLPKGFQISQFDEPIAIGGWIEIGGALSKKKIAITRLHLEDDAGKLTHYDNGTLCDYNRSGIPLMEIVSEPDISNSAEASAYAKSLQTILRYCGSSDADMEKGMMRFDASISIRRIGEKKLYPRAEIKNLNSFRSLEAAIDYEIERQIYLWEGGTPIGRDITVGWSDDRQQTYFLRDKEGADDYRYFPEPDLPVLEITTDFVDGIKKEVPELPVEKCERYISIYCLSEQEAHLLSSDIDMANFFEKTVELSKDAKKAATFITSILISYLKRDSLGIKNLRFGADKLAGLIVAINDGLISMNIGKSQVFEEIYNNGTDPIAYIKDNGLAVENDKSAIEAICKKIMADNSKSVEDYRNGKTNAATFLIGQVMKVTKGQANAKTVTEIMNSLLNIS